MSSVHSEYELLIDWLVHAVVPTHPIQIPGAIITSPEGFLTHCKRLQANGEEQQAITKLRAYKERVIRYQQEGYK